MECPPPDCRPPVYPDPVRRELPAGLAFAFFAAAAVCAFIPSSDGPYIVGGLVVLGVISLVVWVSRFCAMRPDPTRAHETTTGHGVS